MAKDTRSYLWKLIIFLNELTGLAVLKMA